MYVCIYIYIYTYVCVYIYIYTYTHILVLIIMFIPLRAAHATSFVCVCVTMSKLNLGNREPTFKDHNSYICLADSPQDRCVYKRGRAWARARARLVLVGWWEGWRTLDVWTARW